MDAPAPRDFFTRLKERLPRSGAPPRSYMLTRWLFLRALGLVYLFAFGSLAVQITGLIGSHGILPAGDFLSRVAAVYPTPDRYLLLPTFAWINSSDAFLQFLCVGGAVLALLLIFDIATLPVLALLWFFYLSIVNIGQDFLAFQWDILLLEVGFLAIFLAPFHLLPPISRQRAPAMGVIWLFRWLLFRLMFSSGVVKLLSGDPNWRNLTALSYHYWTQPLPTPLAWVMAQLPLWFMQFSTAFTFLIELVVPFLFFMPRRIRFVGGLLTIALQVLILLTGNYTFFNWLTLALCILLFDDDALRRFFPRRLRAAQQRRPSIVKRVIVVPLATVLLFVSGLRLINLFNPRVSPNNLPPVLAQLYQRVSGLYLTNGYGLFAVMTTTRPEIIIEGSKDGQNWLPYEFPYKAGDVNRIPAYVAPYQPRLDWQMWFAALGDYRSNPWLVSFVLRLLQGSPDVLALMTYNPFPDAPPTYIRAQLYQYHFTDWSQHSATGVWWTRQLIGAYLPPLSLANFNPGS